jgi:hypothetical protein
MPSELVIDIVSDLVEVGPRPADISEAFDFQEIIYSFHRRDFVQQIHALTTPQLADAFCYELLGHLCLEVELDALTEARAEELAIELGFSAEEWNARAASWSLKKDGHTEEGF